MRDTAFYSDPEYIKKQQDIRRANRDMTKLTWEDVRAIRRDFAAGWMQPTLADLYGVSQPTISRIVHNISWREPTE